MVLKSKSFLVYKGDTVEEVSSFLKDEIGLDAYLVRGLQAVPLNDNVTQLTLLYEKYPEAIIDSVAPREGSIFSTGSTSNEFDVRFLFNYPVDFRSIVSGTFTIDGVGVETGRVKVDSNSNNYYVKISASGTSFQSQSFHTYQVGPSLKRLDGSSLPYAPVGGYVFNTLSSAYIGDYTQNYVNHRRGEVALAVIRLSKSLSPQHAVSEFFSQRSISPDSLLFYSSTSTSINSLDVYILYIRRLEPQIVGGFPLNNSLLPDVSAPNKVTLVYNTQLDKANLLSRTGLFTIEEGFNTSTIVSADNLNLLSDLKTLEITTSSYFTAKKVYSIVSRPGLLGLNGLSKVKPEQWTVHISTYNAGSDFTGSGSSTGAPLDAYYVLATGNPSLTNAYVLHYDNAITGVLSGTTITLSGIGINEHFANTANPHSTTAAQVGAPTVAQFTGHTGRVDNPHATTAGQVGAPTVSEFTGHTGRIDNPHSVTAGQVGAPTVAQFTGHTGSLDAHTGYLKADGSRNLYGELQSTTAATQPASLVRKNEMDSADTSLLNLQIAHASDSTIHFTQAQISITSTQVSNFTEAVQDAMATGLTGAYVSGIEMYYDDVANTLKVSLSGWLYTGITGHIGNTGIHFTMSQIGITSTQVTDFTEAAQDAVGNAFTVSLSGISVLYNDAGNVINVGMSGWLYTGITGHIGDTGIHYTMSQIGITSTQVTNFTEAAQDAMASGLTGAYVSGIEMFYDDNANALKVSLSGWLYTGITGHIGNTGIHFTMPAINIASTQITDFTEAVQDVVGAPTYYTGMTGVNVLYNDAGNNLVVTLSGWLYSGVTGHISNAGYATGVHMTITAIKNSLANVFQPLNGDLSTIASLGPSKGDMLYYNGTWQLLAAAGVPDGAVITMAGGLPVWSGP